MIKILNITIFKFFLLFLKLHYQLDKKWTELKELFVSWIISIWL